MAIVKSKILKQLSDSYPNFLKKDLIQVLNIILDEIRYSLSREERVEFRGFGTWTTRTQKARKSRNPKTGEEVTISERRVVTFKSGLKLKSKLEAYDGERR
mgnify:CR=1 FL=1